MKLTFLAGFSAVLLIRCGGATVTGDCDVGSSCSPAAPTAPTLPNEKPGTTIPSTVGGKCNADKDCPSGQNCFGSQCIAIGEFMPFPESASLKVDHGAPPPSTR
ncbi:MAG: hypothetical protein SFV15_03245 [Polyangiaceae bacterium]|nr:hypothetical protein [Polyangiaceae bacterium]